MKNPAPYVEYLKPQADVEYEEIAHKELDPVMIR